MALAFVLGAALAVPGCGAGAPADEQAVEAGEADGSAVETGALEAAAGAPGSVPGLGEGDAYQTAGWTDRRELAEADARFPHSEHRSLDCERCHTRPASHVTHPDADCLTCHHRPAVFSTLPDRTPMECAGCHHGQPERECRSCHETDGGARPVLATVAAAGGERVRVRSLTFAHARHAGEDCRRCHDDPVTREFSGDCATCHQSHHRPEAQCTTCHQDPGATVHTAAVHAGCGGAGCHDDAAVLELRATRNVCLTCHTDMTEHRPGRECAACHVGFMDFLTGRAEAGR